LKCVSRAGLLAERAIFITFAHFLFRLAGKKIQQVFRLVVKRAEEVPARFYRPMRLRLPL
jgi:hypothetical protein